MDTCIFNVFGDGIFHYFTVLGYSVEFYFFSILHELGYDYRIFFRNFFSHLQEFLQFIFVIAYVHGSAREHIGRTDQYRVTYFVYKFFHVFQAGQFFPCRLVNTQLVKHGREFMTVFRTVDRKRRSSQYRYRLTVKLHRQVIRYLSTYRYNDTTRLLQINHVKYTFK